MTSEPTTAKFLKALRQETGLSQRAFAELVRTSGPTIAAYESGAKEPRLSTLERIASHARVSVRLRSEPRDRGDRARARRRRRLLALAAAIADAVARDYEQAVRLSEENLSRMASVVGDNQAIELLDEWRAVIPQGPAAVRSALLAPGPHGDDMRQMQPFSGLLDESARLAVLASTDAVHATDAG